MSPQNSSRTEFGTPHRKSTIARSAAGRRCEAEGCETILSTYNSSSSCSLHTQATRRPPLAGQA